MVFAHIKREIVSLLKHGEMLKVQAAEMRTTIEESTQLVHLRDVRIKALERQTAELQHQSKISERGAIRAFFSLQNDLCEFDFENGRLSWGLSGPNICD